VKIRDFFILMDVCYQTPLILGRPFLSTARGTIDVAAGIIKLNINGNVETIAVKPEMTKYCNQVRVLVGSMVENVETHRKKPDQTKYSKTKFMWHVKNVRSTTPPSPGTPICESMDACIYVCTVVKSSIHGSTCPIPSIEFFPTNSPEDKGKLFIHSKPLEQVHIVYMSVTKLSPAERLVLHHLLGATDGNVITDCGHRNVIMCKIADRPPVSCSEGTKDKDRVESCDPSPKCLV
jgi:hypothetical protein